eukprot:07761.XXX_276115_276237_1 [CDS] Oithona nana genome sequencing.
MLALVELRHCLPNFQILCRIKDQGKSRLAGQLPILRFYQR